MINCVILKVGGCLYNTEILIVRAWSGAQMFTKLGVGLMATDDDSVMSSIWLLIINHRAIFFMMMMMLMMIVILHVTQQYET